MPTDLPARAAALDAADPLAPFRKRFVLDDRIYLDGNSLGRLPRESASRVAEVISQWGSEVVIGWEHWIDLGSIIGDELAPLIGAARGEVVVCDQTSVNLFKLASAAVRHVGRPDILSDRGNFPSDLYVLATVAEQAGGRLVLIDEEPTTEEAIAAIDTTIGLVSFSQVSYRSGTIADVAAITAAAHDHGALALWDLAHSAGVLPIELATWGVDLAVGCTYKYLNGGPGSPAFLFVRRDLQERLTPPITGWFGHEDQFGFAERFVPSPSIRRFVVGTPPILSMTATRSGIEISTAAGIDAIRRKSIDLTTFFISAFDEVIPPIDRSAAVASPRSSDRRGSHVAIRHPDAHGISMALRRAGVTTDFRAPDIIRFGFAPLYTTFAECVTAVTELAEILATGDLAIRGPVSEVT